jgi:hypothetical protein
MSDTWSEAVANLPAQHPDREIDLGIKLEVVCAHLDMCRMVLRNVADSWSEAGGPDDDNLEANVAWILRESHPDRFGAEGPA